MRIPPYTLSYYHKRGKYTLPKNTRGWYTAYTRVYPQYTPVYIPKLIASVMKIVTDLKILEYEILQRFQTVKWGF